jgi:hypothetical protein
MRKSMLMAATALVALAAGVLATPRAEAMTVGASGGLGIAADRVDATENVQYYHGGYRHCWYPDGWKGPGWYRCGYHRRHGLGWAGGAGFNGWAAPGVVVVPRHVPPRRGPVVIVR